MEQVNKIVLKRFIASIFFSILFIIGILFIVLGLSNHVGVEAIIGGFITFLEAYLLPLLWFNFAAWCFYKKLYKEIENYEQVTTLELAKKLEKKEKDITKGINILFENGLMNEYKFIDQYKLIKK
ncbi:MAG: hypothetical protein J6W64_01235 [Bacilli bacterium]|nr:hypothetical protein [Bacilli bacterium]